jgi:hypothetical protein
MRKERPAYRVLVGKHKGNRPLGRPRRKWENNIKMDLTGIGLGAWTGLVWLRIRTMADSCECGNEPSVSIKCGKFLD